jgi:hypothetical protein
MILDISDFGVIAGLVVVPLTPLYYQVFANSIHIAEIKQKQEDCKYCQKAKI